MQPQIESLIGSEPGYQPLLISDGWQVAILNWETSMEPEKISEIERHINTDEVFMLGQGRAALYTVIDTVVQLVDLEPGILYNVPRGRWHNLIATRDASLWIVENRDTHLHDTEIRKMSSKEIQQIRSLLPQWAAATHPNTAF